MSKEGKMDPEGEYPQYLLTKIPVIPELRDFLAGCALIARGPKWIDLALARAVGTEFNAEAKEVEPPRWTYVIADAVLKAREGGASEV